MTRAQVQYKINTRAVELMDSGAYQDARDETFTEEFREFMGSYIKQDCSFEVVAEDDVRGFLDNFNFPDETKWVADKAESEYDDVCDAEYELEKDK